MKSFWSRIYKYSKDKVREEHLAKWHNDIKCPNCNEWFSVSGIQYKHDQESIWFGCICTCGQCNYKSYWNLEAFPFPALADKDGNPL